MIGQLLVPAVIGPVFGEPADLGVANPGIGIDAEEMIHRKPSASPAASAACAGWNRGSTSVFLPGSRYREERGRRNAGREAHFESATSVPCPVESGSGVGKDPGWAMTGSPGLRPERTSAKAAS